MTLELVITNAEDTAEALRAAGIGDAAIAWRDILHEGPVTPTDSLFELSERRGGYLQARGWGRQKKPPREFAERDALITRHDDFELVTLWFEDDAFNQLQLWQILDYFFLNPRPKGSLALIAIRGKLATLPQTILRQLAEQPRVVWRSELKLARTLWQAFRDPTPERMADLLKPRMFLDDLDYTRMTLSRLLEELPGSKHGLSRPERMTLQILAGEPMTPEAAFDAYSATEKAPFLGDWSFYALLDRLAYPGAPVRDGRTRPGPALIDGLEAGPFRPQMPHEAREAYLASTMHVTGFGLEVVAGQADRTQHCRMDQWLGGTHVTNDNLWRWDAADEQLIPPM